MLDVLLLLFQGISLNEITLRLHCEVLIIQSNVISLCGVDKLGELVFHI